jgi:GNAT superfamily N-acetyltransferase
VSLGFAGPEEDEEIGELLVRSFVETYAREMPEVVVGESRLRELRDVETIRRNATVLTWTAEGRVAAVCAVYPPGFVGGKAWLPRASELRFMAVHPDFQGQGVASPLLESALREAVGKQGAHTMCLHVRRGAHGVARFYARHGFERDVRGDRDLLPEIYLEGFARQIGP